MSLLHQAISTYSHNQHAKTVALLDAGADINSLDDEGESPLTLAIRSGNEIVVDLLLERGADVNLNSKDGQCPLHEAIFTENILVMKRLLEKGADLERRGRWGYTPLYCAVEFSFAQGVDLLLDEGANANEKDNYFTPVCHQVVLNGGNDDILLKLLESGAELECCDVDGKGLLYWSVSRNLHSTVHLLLNKGARLDVYCSYSRSILDVASDDAMKKILMHHICKVYVLRQGISLKKDFNGEPTPWSLKSSLENEIDKEYFSLYCTSCEEEWAKIKARKISNSFLSDVLLLRNITFAANFEMEDTIQSSNLEQEFPIYSDLLKEFFKKAKKRYYYMKEAQEIFRITLPLEIKWMILSYLTDHDLRSVVKAWNM